MKAIIYRRVSKEDGGVTGKQGLQRQKLQIDNYLKTRSDIVVVKDIAVNGISGTIIDENQKLQEMLSMLDQVDAVIVSEIDRLVRPKNFTALKMLDEFQRTNTLIITSTGNTYDLNKDTDSFQISILTGVASFELKRIRARMISGRENKLRKGYKFAPKAHTGWKWDEKKIKYVLSDDAPKLRKAVQLYIQGWSIRKIAQHLGYTRSFIFRLLRDEMLIGINKVNFQGNTYLINTEPLIDKDTWKLLQKKIAGVDKVYSKLKTKDFKTGLLSAMLFDESGQIYYSMSFKKRKRLKSGELKVYPVSYYISKDRKYTVNLKETDKTFYRYLRDKQDEIFSRLTKEYVRQQAVQDAEKIKKDIKNIENKIINLINKKDRIKDLYIDGDIDKNEYQQRMRDNNNEIVILNSEKDRLETQLQDTTLYELTALYVLHEFLKYVGGYKYEKQRELVRRYIDKVVFRRLEYKKVEIVEVSFKSPKEIDVTEDDILNFINEVGLNKNFKKVLEQYVDTKDKRFDKLSQLNV